MCVWGIWLIARVTIHAANHAPPPSSPIHTHRQQQAQGCVSFQLKNFSLCATLSCGFLQLPSASFLRLPVVFGILRRRHWINVNPCYPSFYVAAACIFICIPHSLLLSLPLCPTPCCIAPFRCLCAPSQPHFLRCPQPPSPLCRCHLPLQFRLVLFYASPQSAVCVWMYVCVCLLRSVLSCFVIMVTYVLQNFMCTLAANHNSKPDK